MARTNHPLQEGNLLGQVSWYHVCQENTPSRQTDLWYNTMAASLRKSTMMAMSHQHGTHWCLDPASSSVASKQAGGVIQPAAEDMLLQVATHLVRQEC